ncbi:uncharacterized protein LOC108213271 [Daucus carota subsp. sativus]|uniref:uncharacterized protein LOC108213271 n=1 Tax=Daucus carota subsp. sativus TaxID=79200 RepID=UPI0007EF0F8A|nr:PREDICTED: uncharacterized protein LOC108213271 [Daucus carota subsp. sativus]
MSSTLEHFSHDHPLVLKESDVFEDDPKCCICNNTVTGSPTYTCSNSASNNTECPTFYLHKSCAELPSQINFYKHNQHPLHLLPRPNKFTCDVCDRYVKFSYACDDCQFDVCVVCAFQQRVLQHEGHPEHILTLMPRKSLFKCDACHEKVEDSSYVCTTCALCIHKACALSPFTIPAPAFHHHPLHLIYSVPQMHRYFDRFCNICQRRVHTNFWLYYCHKCTYFVHMRCATSSHTSSSVNETEEEGSLNEPDLVEFPLHSEESLFDLIISQCRKLQVESQGIDKNSIGIITAPDPPIIEHHWSHEEHPLVLFQFTTSETEDNENNYDRRELICDGCIQPITVFHPSYYACTQCGFFLHSFCATKLPAVLVAGLCPPHPQHSLQLHQKFNFYTFATCEICCYRTNGFYYLCKTCDTRIDIRCAFLPTKIKHKSHRHHSLVQRLSSNFECSVSGCYITSGVQYGCETCSDFHIVINSAFYPGSMKHRYDDHPVTLRRPPFFYEGVFYCEICEDRVNNQWWLYHCDECDHSFHNGCLLSGGSVKLGGTVEVDFNDQSHTLALVLKRRTRKTQPQYYCRYCGNGYIWNYFLECDGCGYLICCPCVRKIKASNKSIHF